MKHPVPRYALDPHDAAEERVADGTATEADRKLISDGSSGYPTEAEFLATFKLALEESKGNPRSLEDLATNGGTEPPCPIVFHPVAIERLKRSPRRNRKFKEWQRRGSKPEELFRLAASPLSVAALRARGISHCGVPSSDRTASSSRTSGTDPGPEESTDSDPDICVSLDCSRPVARRSKGPKAVYCDDPSCQRRDERRRKGRERLASEAWQPASDLEREASREIAFVRLCLSLLGDSAASSGAPDDYLVDPRRDPWHGHREEKREAGEGGGVLGYDLAIADILKSNGHLSRPPGFTVSATRPWPIPGGYRRTRVKRREKPTARAEAPPKAASSPDATVVDLAGYRQLSVPRWSFAPAWPAKRLAVPA
jgi:hypothetical protein